MSLWWQNTIAICFGSFLVVTGCLGSNIQYELDGYDLDINCGNEVHREWVFNTFIIIMPHISTDQLYCTTLCLRVNGTKYSHGEPWFAMEKTRFMPNNAYACSYCNGWRCIGFYGCWFTPNDYCTSLNKKGPVNDIGSSVDITLYHNSN